MEENLRRLVASDSIGGNVESITTFGVHCDKSRASVGVGRHRRIEGNCMGFAGFGGDAEGG